MGAFFVYIIKSAACLAVFYLFYRLLLSRETFHRFNRIALLGILVLSCVLPLVEVTMQEPMEVSRQLLTWEELLLMADIRQAAVAEATATPVPAWRETLLMVYLAGILFFFLRNLWSLGRMLRLIRGSHLVRRADGILLVTHRKEIAPFSWMKFVVISEKDMQENGNEILVHECAHIRAGHSIDLLVADVCIFFQWFNPAAWLLKQELQNIHEYEADERVIAQGIDAKNYQLLLIKKAVGTRLYSMANSFNHSSLKKRITMMLRKRSNPWARLKYLYVLPLAAIAVAAFARPEISKELNEISAVKVNDLTSMVKAEEVKSVETPPVGQDTLRIKGKSEAKEQKAEWQVVGFTSKEAEPDSSPVFQVVDVMPEYPGGMKECMNFLGTNIKYPAEAQKAGKQGRVIVQFVVETDGSVSHPAVVRSVDPWLDGEAIRVISIMPKWKPGLQKGQPVRVKYTIPVTFSLDRKNGSDSVAVKHPLVIIDGQKVPYEEMQQFDPLKIESVSVLKNDQTLKYGTEGKNGVILITTKKKE